MGVFATYKDVITLSVTILLALLGLLATYLNNLAIARRRDRLERVNAQLKLLYGPLFALTQASLSAWEAFRKNHRPGIPYFSKSRPPTEDEAQAWRLWMTKTFMPLNRQMVNAITTNADLLEGEMPAAFLALVAHVTAYESILAQWELNNFQEHVPLVLFPKEIEDIVSDTYKRLRTAQAKLLKSSGSK